MLRTMRLSSCEGSSMAPPHGQPVLVCEASQDVAQAACFSEACDLAVPLKACHAALERVVFGQAAAPGFCKLCLASRCLHAGQL